MTPATFPGLKTIKITTEALPQTPLDELTALPRLNSWILRKKRGKGKDREDGEEGKKEGVAPPPPPKKK